MTNSELPSGFMYSFKKKNFNLLFFRVFFLFRKKMGRSSPRTSSRGKKKGGGGGILSNIKKKAKKVGKGAVKAGKVGVAAVGLAHKLTNPINQLKFAAKAATGGGFILPGTKYIGPGNAMDLGKPVNAADAAAYQHDKDYDNMINNVGKSKAKVYWGFSDADQRLMDRSDVTTTDGLATYLGMAPKKLINRFGLSGKQIHH